MAYGTAGRPVSGEVGQLDSRTSAAMRAVLDLENEAPDALLEILPGTTVPFWAQVRVQIAWALSAKETGSVEVASTSTWSRWGETKRVARGFLPSRWDAVRKATQRDVCFYVSGATLAVEGGRARNWLVDDFAEAACGAVVVQQRPLPSPVGRPVFRPTRSMEAATARARWRARGKPLTPGFAVSMNRLLSEYERRLEQPVDSFAAIGQGVLRSESLRPFQLDELKRMLDRTRPKIVFFDNGSYTYHGEFVGLMKDAGAYIVEPQHGWIGPSHAAYNFGRVFNQHELRRALPDELLTFGTYWSDSIRYPGRVTAIGKPHLERKAALATTERPSQILVVSSRTDPEATDAFVIALHKQIREDWSIVFRPHPGERAETARRYPRLSATTDIKVDDSPDVYESLIGSAVVIGEASTVLFEARAFGCQVIARDSPFAENVIGDTFGDRVGDVDQTVSRLHRIRAGGAIIASTDPSIWAPRPIETFDRWLTERRGERSEE